MGARLDATPKPVSPWVDRGLAFVLGALFFVALMWTMDLGYTRDEGYYFHAAEAYLGWFKELADNLGRWELLESFGQASVDRYWGYNAEHPPLPKALFALSKWIFADGLGWMSPATAMRMVGALFAAALVAMVYRFTSEVFGRWEGVVAAICTAAMPRPFFHAHMAAFDYPMVTLWFAVLYCYWRSLGSRWFGVLTGVVFGLALSVKHNAFFLPAVVGLHWIVTSGMQTRLVSTEKGRRLQLPAVPVAFVSMAVLGPLVWYLLWPRHWFDTYNRIVWYFEFHLQHVHYFQYYFGDNLYEPPFPVEFPFVMSLLTMPEVTIFAFFAGVGVLAWRRYGRGQTSGAESTAGEGHGRGTLTLLAMGGFIPFAIIAVPSTPIFGGIKHWMPAMPYVAMVAAVGAVAAGRALSEPLARRYGSRVSAGALVLFLALLLAPAITATVHSHGYGLAHYNTLIGGIRGAADASMMRQYWGYSSVHILPDLNEEVPRSASVFFQNTNHDSYDLYKRTRQLRSDIRYGPMAASSFAMIHDQMAARSLELEIWRAYGTRNPAFVGAYDGVPVITVYRNERRRPPKRRRHRVPQKMPPKKK